MNSLPRESRAEQVVQLPAAKPPLRLSTLFAHLLVGPPTGAAARERDRANGLRVLQRQLENARVYLAAATQLEVGDDLLEQRVSRAALEVQTLVEIATRRRNELTDRD
ncbi:MAG TPA: hypothetical protein VNG93_05135 [Candidatus Dormibacteraeota bacterium]|nr:hypothetical protein [Candidatus Dormibacteraeota bacterium]